MPLLSLECPFAHALTPVLCVLDPLGDAIISRFDVAVEVESALEGFGAAKVDPMKEASVSGRGVTSFYL